MNHAFFCYIFFSVACFLNLSLLTGCGDTEVPEGDIRPSTLYEFDPAYYEINAEDYEINAEDIRELMTLDIPTNWYQTKDPELRAKYYYAQLIKQFGDIPAVHIVGQHARNKALGITQMSLDDAISLAKANYLLWPSRSAREHLETLLKSKLIHTTEDPELYAKLLRERLIKQHGDIPEVHIVVAGEKKRKFGGFRFPEDYDEYLAFFEARYVLSPNRSVLRELEILRKAIVEGTPFHLIDWDDDDE